MIFDYLGLWSEAPGGHTVDVSAAVDCLVSYLDVAVAATAATFEPD